MTATRWLLIPGFCALFLTACPGTQKSSEVLDEEHDAIAQHSIVKGMDAHGVIASLGKPARVTTSKLGNMPVEEWTYASGSSVTFTKGIVSNFRLGPASTPKRGDWMFKDYKNPLEQRPRSHH